MVKVNPEFQKRCAGFYASRARGTLRGPFGHPLPSVRLPSFLRSPVLHGGRLSPRSVCAAPSGPQSRPCAQTPDQGRSVPAPRPSGHSDGESNGYDQAGCGKIEPPGCRRLLKRPLQIPTNIGASYHSGCVRHRLEEPEGKTRPSPAPAQPQPAPWPALGNQRACPRLEPFPQSALWTAHGILWSCL